MTIQELLNFIQHGVELGVLKLDCPVKAIAQWDDGSPIRVDVSTGCFYGELLIELEELK